MRTDITTTNETIRLLGLLRQVTTQERQLRHLQTGNIRPNDDRLDAFWDEMDELANDLDFCSVYDDVKAAMGVPGDRTKEYDVTVVVEVQFDIAVRARSEDEAVENAEQEWDVDDIRNQLSAYNIENVRAWV